MEVLYAESEAKAISSEELWQFQEQENTFQMLSRLGLAGQVRALDAGTIDCEEGDDVRRPASN